MSTDDAKLSPSYGGASSKLLEIGGLSGPEFNREAATRMMRDLFAPWVLDLGLSIEALQLRHLLTPQLMATH